MRSSRACGGGRCGGRESKEGWRRRARAVSAGPSASERHLARGRGRRGREATHSVADILVLGGLLALLHRVVAVARRHALGAARGAERERVSEGCEAGAGDEMTLRGRTCGRQRARRRGPGCGRRGGYGWRRAWCTGVVVARKAGVEEEGEEEARLGDEERIGSWLRGTACRTLSSPQDGSKPC